MRRPPAPGTVRPRRACGDLSQPSPSKAGVPGEADERLVAHARDLFVVALWAMTNQDAV